jgi:hypothetical protein
MMWFVQRHRGDASLHHNADPAAEADIAKKDITSTYDVIHRSYPIFRKRIITGARRLLR